MKTKRNAKHKHPILWVWTRVSLIYDLKISWYRNDSFNQSFNPYVMCKCMRCVCLCMRVRDHLHIEQRAYNPNHQIHELIWTKEALTTCVSFELYLYATIVVTVNQFDIYDPVVGLLFITNKNLFLSRTYAHFIFERIHENFHNVVDNFFIKFSKARPFSYRDFVWSYFNANNINSVNSSLLLFICFVSMIRQFLKSKAQFLSIWCWRCQCRIQPLKSHNMLREVKDLLAITDRRFLYSIRSQIKRSLFLLNMQ